MAIPRWEIMLGQIVGMVVGLALIAGGVELWIMKPAATLSTVTVSVTSNPNSHHHSHTKTVTTSTLHGPSGSAKAADAAGAKPRRSATVTVGLVAAGALLLLGSSWLPRLRSLVVVPPVPKPAEEEAGDDS